MGTTILRNRHRETLNFCKVLLHNVSSPPPPMGLGIGLFVQFLMSSHSPSHLPVSRADAPVFRRTARTGRHRRGSAILLRLLTLVMAQHTIPTVGGAVTTTAAVSILLASQVAHAQTTPAKPTGFRVVERSAALILVWTKPASVNKWQYQYQAGSGQWTDWQDVVNPKASGTIRSYRLTGLTNGTAYKVKIRAVSGATPGTASDEDSGTPNASRVPGVTLRSLGEDVHTFTGSGTWYLDDNYTAARGNAEEYTIVLDAEPVGGDVTLAIASTSTYITTTPTSLTFTPGDWDTRQTVQINVPADGNSASETATISHSATGGGYDVVKITSFTIKSMDANAKPNKPVSLKALQVTGK